ncbi:hypothetical protein X798_07113 [Onchocerca flexuosa]|uniref:Uncharacterized protein n=1 Tax=Onchocerca flexuosa TaxID=387005 RepID=A0A238BKE4_9BILA|nr:hypothetical protein X798_07113 [Onchocerca flexuosa]
MNINTYFAFRKNTFFANNPVIPLNLPTICSSTKFAIRGIMQCLEIEMKERGLNGIHCTTVCPYFTRTPMILNLRMRPTSTWFPFMSIDRCACEIVDAVLREKSIVFVPRGKEFICQPNYHRLLPERVEDAWREYLNCQYEPLEDQEMEDEEITLAKKTDYFEGLDANKKYMLLIAYLIIMISYLVMQGVMQTMLQTLD